LDTIESSGCFYLIAGSGLTGLFVYFYKLLLSNENARDL
jgi:hypothetical protein